jgi:DNA-directed RNA polymerase subunit RPC12/RpoP
VLFILFRNGGAWKLKPTTQFECMNKECGVIIIDNSRRDGLRCPVCAGAVLPKPYEPNQTRKFTKPPLGLRPRYIADAQRLQEISLAMLRYIGAAYIIPKEWLEEYKEISERLIIRKSEKKASATTKLEGFASPGVVYDELVD